MKEQDVTLTAEEYNLLIEENQKMRTELDELQQEHETTKQQISEVLEKQLKTIQERADTTAMIASLRWQIMDLKRRLWGKSSEKRSLPADPQDLSICTGSPSDVEDPVAEETQAKEKAKKSEGSYSRFRKTFTAKVQPHARKPIDPSLPRQEITVPMPEGLDMTGAVRMGEEVTERYAIRPAQLYVIRTIRPKYRFPDGRIITAPMPVMAHPRSNASESILAHIAVSKYADHLPLHRQLEIFQREGIRLAPSTLSNWMMATAQRVEPIYNELRERVKSSPYVMADETPHPVLESDKPGSLHQGYMWNFYLPDCHAPFFEYHRGRGAQGVETLLAGDVQTVQSDGFAVYDVFDTLPGKLHLCCWAHVRRKFVEAESSAPLLARQVLDKISGLYAVEKEIQGKGLAEKEIVDLRQQKAYPIIRELEQWCKQEYGQMIIDSPIDKATRYMYTRFEQLSGYVNDARFHIDNNPVERSIRPLTLNRKNTLFSGSHEAAHAAAIFFTLLGTCKENEVNPKEWLQEVLIKVEDVKDKNDYSKLLPFNWKK